MALVAYSDSEGSDEDVSQSAVPKATDKPAANFTIDKSNPGTIKVNLQQKFEPSSSNGHDDEPARKRPRVGAGGLGSFNSMLPAPKRDGTSNISEGATKSKSRAVFSLKTGAEASFSRESDAELRNSLAEQSASQAPKSTQTSDLPMPPFAKPAAPAASGTPFMFKPLSVSRTSKKKKTAPLIPSANKDMTEQKDINQPSVTIPSEPPPRIKISLFSAGTESIPSVPDTALDPNDDIGQDHELQFEAPEQTYSYEATSATSDAQPQSLDSIASDLNLTSAQRRQLFGRSGHLGTSAINVVNFNTDDEYAANQALIAAGETVQHNPVRAIAPGKHSLRQLVNAAAGQKEALEESFAEGRRNKKEAGNKYGW